MNEEDKAGIKNDLELAMGKVKNQQPSRAGSLVITKIEEALMWLEKV